MDQISATDLGPASAPIYSLGTGKQSFFTYSARAAIAKMAADGGLNLRVKPFGGTSAYVPGVNAGEQQFGLATFSGCWRSPAMT